MKNKIVKLDVLIKSIISKREEGKVIVATSGCFDILHAGHVQYLEKARECGDVFVLFLNSDKSVRQLKGPERPIVPEEQRAEVVAGLGCIDYVCIFNEMTPSEIIEKVKPDIWVKGADYQGVDIPEKKIIDTYGGIIRYIDFKEGCSSTNIIERIRELQ